MSGSKHNFLLLRQILGTPTANSQPFGLDSPDSGAFSLRRRRPESFRTPSMIARDEFTDGDDEILESLVKTATKAPGTRTQPRERKRTRNADRKSCKYFTLAAPFPPLSSSLSLSFSPTLTLLFRINEDYFLPN